MTPEEARAQFPVLERVSYLNAGTIRVDGGIRMQPK